jgi:hypothetical protein
MKPPKPETLILRANTCFHSTLFVQATLKRQTGNFEAAIHDLTIAQSIWLSAGKKDAQGNWTMSGGKQLHHFNAACLYKLGCVAFDIAQAHDDSW